MSDYELKDRSFNVFKNKFAKSENDYDFTGDALIDDQEHFANVWVKTTKNGDQYLSISLKPKKPIIKKHIKEINDDLDYEKYVEYAKEQNADHLIEMQQTEKQSEVSKKVFDPFDDDITF